MSLLGKAKSAILTSLARRQGAAMQKEPIMQWMKQNKALIGTIFGIISGALLASPWAPKATPILALVSAFLVGAGAMDSDKASKEKGQ